MKPRYLTKSRFKLALECPTKLFYTSKSDYANSKLDDAFLNSLAEGGYQVGELAKAYYSPGHNIDTLDYKEAESLTKDLLIQQNITIFEPAIRYKNLFIRVDILVKQGNYIDLIEVKAKSYDPNCDEDQFLTKREGKIQSGWKPYLYDIAFQKYVLEKAYPDFKVKSYLLMANKSAVCSVEGLNQKFKIIRDENNRKGIKVSGNLSAADLKEKILVSVPVDKYVSMILSDKEPFATGINSSFEKEVEYLATQYEQDIKIVCGIGSKCVSCEFKSDSLDKKDGFKECWKHHLNWTESDFKEESILSLWNCRKKDEFISKGLLKLKDLEEEDINPKPSLKKNGLSPTERQCLQIEKAKNRDITHFLDIQGIRNEMESWVYPLHCIDFETTMVAIPFNKGRRSYEAIAFQFSHHEIQKDGAVEHKGQFLCCEIGKFPNYEFLRELRKQLEKDKGTIFRYSPHENSFLNHIYQQLKEEISPTDDKEALCNFIKSITQSSGYAIEKWEGTRNMVDLWDQVKRYYYHPKTHGSNSIKYVLPAILNSSNYLKAKYSKPIYGAAGGIKSLNFKDWTWIEVKDGEVVDPYRKLPKLFNDLSEHEEELLTSQEDELRNGGAAMSAYARMQFSEMSNYERNELQNALLKYCELDTMAMVMIIEGWREMDRNHK